MPIKKKHPDLPLIAVDDLCLASLGEYFRCDKDANHQGLCSHTHVDEQLCNWLDSFTDDLTQKHRKVKAFNAGPSEDKADNRWIGGMY